jgi:translocation and assembly module TamB
MRKTVKRAGGGLLGLLLALALGLALAQTRPGKLWLAEIIGRALSDASDHVTLTQLTGFVPFNMAVEQIIVADANGPRLVIADAELVVTPAPLLRGRLAIRRLAAREIRVDRPGQGGEDDLALLLHPPLPVSLERLQVERLILGRELIGEPITLTLIASGAVGDGRAAADIDARRSDGVPGEARLHVALAGAPLSLALAGEIAEPTGRVLAGLLGQPDPLPVTLTLKGDGPLSDWRGSLAATAGSDAALHADFQLQGEDTRHFTATGSARPGSLVPPPLRSVTGQTDFSAALSVGDGATILDDFALTAAAGSLSARGRLDRAGDGISGKAVLKLPDLAVLPPLLGRDLAGATTVDLTLSGKLAAPRVHVALTGEPLDLGGDRARKVTAEIEVRGRGNLLDNATPVDITGSGEIDDLALATQPLPTGLGDRIAWRLAGQLDRAANRLTLTELAVTSGASALDAHGTADRDGASGHAHLDSTDIGRLIDAELRGAVALDAEFRVAPDGAASATLSGAIGQPKSGSGALDRLLGEKATLAATLRRAADGALSITGISVDAANAQMSGEAARDATGRITATYRTSLPRLQALDDMVVGSARVTGELGGTTQALSARTTLEADGVAVGAGHFEHLEAQLNLRDLARPAGRLDVTFRGPGIAGTAFAEGTLSPGGALELTHLHLDAAETRLDGKLTLRLPTGTIDGALSGVAPDLAPWSTLAGLPLGGSAQIKADFAAQKGQSVALTFDGRNIVVGSTLARARRLQGTARLGDIFAKPTGQAEVQLEDGSIGRSSIAHLKLSGASDRPGRFVLNGTAQGEIGDRFDLAMAATAALDRRGAEMQVTRLNGRFGNQPVLLHRPLLLSRRAGDLAFADLDLGLGAGRIGGSGSIKGTALALHVQVRDLPMHSLSSLSGQQDTTGVLGAELTLSGTRQRPEGRLVVDGEALRFAIAGRPDLPPLGLVIAADWHGERVAFKGRLAGPHNAALGFSGEAPLRLDPQSLAVHLPPDGAIELHLEGEGELANLVDLLPLGEDRLAGRFVVDVSVRGSVAAPMASGKLSVRDGRYETIATGTILAGVSFDLVGNHDRLVLENFTATDGAQGSFAVTGAVNLTATDVPTLDLAGQFKRFRALQRDDATANLTGEARWTGSIAAPHLMARLRIEQAELRVPERLPQSARPIPVTRIDSASGEVLATPDEQARQASWVAVELDATIDMPGQVFVRGRGLDSEWRGRLTVTGTTAAPRLEGKLEVVRGTYDFLGKTADLSRGSIAFIGGERLDPEVNIEARVTSTEATAIIQITGTATQPTIRLSSQPELPQDEILARVLFGTNVSQVSTGQALEIAQAAAALATGGGPGVLDRIRRGLGLDRLSVGSATATSPVSGVTLPSLGAPPGIPSTLPSTAVGASPAPLGATGSSAAVGGTGVSAGKYVASGVYVGVTQGLGAGSSSVDVQIDVTRHITIDTTAGQITGTGVGVNWKLDY